VGGGHSAAVLDRSVTYTATDSAAASAKPVRKRSEKDVRLELMAKRQKCLQDSENVFNAYSEATKLILGPLDSFQYTLYMASTELHKEWKGMANQVRTSASRRAATPWAPVVHGGGLAGVALM